MRLALLLATLVFSGATCFAAELDGVLDMENVGNVSNDGYVIIGHTATGEIVRADARSLKIMEIDFVAEGSTDGSTGNVVGNPYEPSKIALIGKSSVSHEGFTYHAFQKLDGSMVRITVDDATNKVVEISCFAKELNS